MISLDDVKSAAAVIQGIATRTPLLRSIELDRLSGGRIYVKADCLQLTGSFKFRGAYNRLSRLSEEEKKRGVVAYSSGNHAQGVAYAAKILGIDATIVMPEDAPSMKIEKTRSHGARIVLYDRLNEVREDIGARLVAETGAILVPPYEDPFIMAGQGTSALEALEDVKLYEDVPFDDYIVNTGGGGLLAGSSTVIKALSPTTRVYSVEPEGYDDHARSFASGERQRVSEDAAQSICDSIMTPEPGEKTFAINKMNVEGGLVVSDDDIRYAMQFAALNLKIVVEPGGAAALAAVLAGKITTKGRVIGLTVTGGNVDANMFGDIVTN